MLIHLPSLKGSTNASYHVINHIDYDDPPPRLHILLPALVNVFSRLRGLVALVAIYPNPNAPETLHVFELFPHL